MLSSKSLRRIALMAGATGIRSMSPLALLAYAALRGRPTIPEAPPFSLLRNPEVVRWLLWAAAGEAVADKLPLTPARTSAGPLLFRVGVGAAIGWMIATDDRESAPVGASAGSVTALLSTEITYRIRTALLGVGVPNGVAGSLGDTAAVALASSAIRSFPRGVA